jgi:hypothetical protein
LPFSTNVTAPCLLFRPFRTDRQLTDASASAFAKLRRTGPHSSTALRSLRDASASSVARASAEGRDRRGQAMEEIMAHWTVGKLMHLTRDELCDLANTVEGYLAGFEVGTVERHDALVTLNNVRRVAVMRGLYL